MKKAKATNELRPDYKREDLGVGVRGKYYKEYCKGSNLVLLSPDVAEVFSTEEAVNEALRSLISIAEKSTCILLFIVYLFGISAFAVNCSAAEQTPSQKSNISQKDAPPVCHQCGVWKLSSSDPDGLVGDIVFVDDHQIVISECGVFNYKVEKSEITVERKGCNIYNLSLSLSSGGEMSPLCKEEQGDTWKMDVKVRGRGSADFVLSKHKVKQPILWLFGWNIDREGPCDWGGGEQTARCQRIKERLVFKMLSVKVEQAYEKLLRSIPSSKLPTFSASRFSATVKDFCEDKEKDTGGAGWPIAWAYTCKNRILESKLIEFSLWNECVENKHKICIFPNENFDRSPESEIQQIIANE